MANNYKNLDNLWDPIVSNVPIILSDESGHQIGPLVILTSLLQAYDRRSLSATNFVSKSLDIKFLIAPVLADSTGSPSSTTVDQDAPSPSNSQTTPETEPLVIPNDVEEDNHDIEVAHMGNDPYFGVPIPEIPSDQPYNIDSIPTILPVSTRLQLHEQALFCYYDAFLTAVEPKTYKDALTQACWIEAMQEELNEFQRLKNKSDIVARDTVKRGIDLEDLCSCEIKANGLFINQSKYALESLKKYGFDSCDPVDTPMVEKSKLDEDKEVKAKDPSHYRSMIGTLVILQPVTYLPLVNMHSVPRYQHRALRKALNAVKKIFRLSKRTVHRGLGIRRIPSIALTAFAYAEHVGCQDTRRHHVWTYATYG
ncbi:hypothetical protein Tco_0123716 [Tanacetum coccineum]